MPGRTSTRRLILLATLGALALSGAACGSTPGAAVKFSSSAGASSAPSTNSSASASDAPTPGPSTSTTAEASPTPTPTATPADADPAYIPALASIQMVGPKTGWVAGSHAIYATTDGTHWARQYASTNDYDGVDFISQTTGWVVGLHELLGTTDGGHTWRTLGEASGSLRSVHFSNASQGWGIAGGSYVQPDHGTLLPNVGAGLVASNDGGNSWSPLNSPANPQSVCFSDPTHGWLATADAHVYQSSDAGQSWTPTLSMYGAGPGPGNRIRVQCAAPTAAWVMQTVENGAAGHLPYVVYSTQDGHSWRTVMTEQYTIGNNLLGVPPGPDSHPGSFSVVDPLDAVFVGDGPATNVAACIVANGGGATLRPTGKINNSSETYGAAFTAVTTGWVLTRDESSGNLVIDATTDGGYHWSQQLAVAPTSAG